jgi:soluble P-type ATPase
MLGKLNACFGMSNERGMERYDILLMVGSGNNSTLAMRRTFLTIQGILDLVLAPME